MFENFQIIYIQQQVRILIYIKLAVFNYDITGHIIMIKGRVYSRFPFIFSKNSLSY